MLVIALGHGNTISVIKPAVNVRDFAKSLMRAFDGKEIKYGCGYEDRARVHQQEQSWMVNSIRDHAIEVLLRIAIGILEDAIVDAHRQCRYITGRRCYLDPII